MAYFMYVALQDDDKVLVLEMDPNTGSLARKAEAPIVGAPSALAISPDRQTLYIGHRNTNELSSHRINQGTGELTQVGKISVDASPTYLAADRKGKYMLSAYYQGARVGVHSIGDDGALVAPPIEWIETDNGAHCILSDPSNRYAFVPHIARIQDNVMQPPGDNYGPNVIYQFKFDEDTGSLTPNSPLQLPMSEFLGPRHFIFHPTQSVAYFSNEQGCSVSAYALDADGGTLSAVQTVSTLPEGFSGRNTCSQIQVSGNGEFLYVPNRGHNSIAGFSVDASTGQLTPLGQVATEAVPSAFSLDPQGKFVYAAGSETGNLASYQINGDTGELTPMQTYAVGARPMGVLITDLSG
jgi:6-phosphogluconolactonase